MKRTPKFLTTVTLATVAGLLATPSPPSYAADAGGPREVKVLIINMFGPEGQPFIEKLALTDDIEIPGLSPDYPKVHCNTDDVCEITTGMGHTNVAASISALVYSGKLDLSSTYFLIA